jgi:hypothetical protein
LEAGFQQRELLAVTQFIPGICRVFLGKLLLPRSELLKTRRRDPA